MLVIAVAIVDMDRDPGSSGVSTLATQEANRARRKNERIASRGKEKGANHVRDCRAEETRFTADRNDELHQIARQRYASLDAALEVLSKLLRSTIQALCNREEY